MKAPGSGWEVRAEPLLITDTRFWELINIQSRGQRGVGGGGGGTTEEEEAAVFELSPQMSVRKEASCLGTGQP